MSEQIKPPPGTPSSKIPKMKQSTPSSGFGILKQSQEPAPDMSKYQDMTPSKPPRIHHNAPSPSHEADIQVPATQQPAEAEDEDDDMLEARDLRRETEANHDDEENYEEEESEHLPPEPQPQAPDEDLPPFDWNDFEARYAAEMARVREKEVAILEEFATLSSFFATWSNVPSAHDEHRAVKRLKTREFYVQHSESMFQEKKKHYAQVVDAFKKALDLLG